MTNETTEKQNQKDHALAQLLIHAPRNNADGHGAEVTLEELALLNEGKLSEQRREQVIGQLDSNSALYDIWQGSQEMASHAESLNLEASTEANKTSKSTAPSLLDQISHFLSDLFSWQGAFATSFGIALGVILMSQTGLDSSKSDSDFGQGIAMQAPIQAPQKASTDHVGSIAPTQEIAKVEVLRIEGNTVHLKVILTTGEEINETYVYKPGKQ